MPAGRFIAALVAVATLAAAPPAPEWRAPWSRDADAVSAVRDDSVRRGSDPSIRIEHRGRQDWCLQHNTVLDVAEGDIIELGGWLRLRGEGEAGLSVITYDGAGKVRDWTFGQRNLRAAEDWQPAGHRVVIGAGIRRIVPRLVGNGPATVWLAGFSIRKVGNISDMRDRNTPPSVKLQNAAIAVEISTTDAAMTVTDRRTGAVFAQRAAAKDAVVKSAAVSGAEARLELLGVPTSLDLRLTVRLEGEKPEMVCVLTGDGEMPRAISLPCPFVTDRGTYLVVPMNEGISYPVDDQTINPMRLIAYGGHGICMAFFGATDGRRGYMGIIETPDDAAIRIRREGDLLCIAPEWDAQKGRFGYARSLRYVFFDAGGHVAMCKRYRQHAQQTGLLRTLADKRRDNPHIDLLVGAVNVWCWERDALSIVKEMKAAGIDRILWSNRAAPETIRAMNDMGGVLTSRYDIYQDTMNPENFKFLRGVHSDWTTEAWPDDLMRDARGDWIRGWRVKGKDDQWYPCGVLCDRRAPEYAEKRIPAELATHPYRCRFIDTTTASPWRECYDARHPCTRTESRQFKMELLRLVSQKYKLVCGSETGHDAAVPVCDYFEGMLSLGPYRVPDAGRDMQRIWDEVPANVAKFQVGHAYRLPLWELVYHDCLVAQWYWGDYNNKLPAIWRKRDLFNVLYGTPPMFMFNRKLWESNRERFVRSYRDTCTVARAVGYAEMTDHRFLSPDRAVQQTVFSNGVSVTVNFGNAPWRMPDGRELPGESFDVASLPQK